MTCLPHHTTPAASLALVCARRAPLYSLGTRLRLPRVSVAYPTGTR